MRKPRAIVYNDSEVIQGVFGRILERMGYEVLTVETPITCAFHRGMLMVALSIGGATDILTTYYDMPDMTGMELLDLQHQKRFKLSSKNKTRMTVSEELVPRGESSGSGMPFFPKGTVYTHSRGMGRDCERSIDLSEPAASGLFLLVKRPFTSR
jgi:CheY-like chemotaxis protein